MAKLAPIFFLLRPLAAAQDAPDERSAAMIVVRLPADAKLWIDDYAPGQTGPERHFSTPPLQRKSTYYYTLRVELVREGRQLTGSKQIAVRAGETTTVDFPEPADLRADTPKPKAKPPSPSPSLSQYEQAVLDLTNQERKKAGLAPLRSNDILTQAARAHSANMARQKKLDHTLDDKGPAERVREAGYRGFGWGENIAYGMPTPAAVMEAWMGSKGHRANILNESFDEIGVGVIVDQRGVPFYTQVFGVGARR